MGINGLLMESNQRVIERELPPQLAESALVMADIVSTAATSTQGVVILNFTLNIVVSASLQSIWNMINAQQLIVLMPLFDMVMPANA